MSARRRVLAIRSGALGDTIVAVPAIAALSRTHVVEVLGTTPYIELLTSAGLAVAAHSMDRAMFRALFQEDAADDDLFELLARFGRVVCWSRLPLLAPKLDSLGIELIQSTSLPPAGTHASDHLFAALEPIGITGPAPFPRLEIAGRVSGLTSKCVALHPSSGSPSKNWAPERFAAVAKLARGAGLNVVWIQGEADGHVVPDLVSQVPGRVARNRPLPELAAILAGCAVYVGNDSGVSHLAAAVGAPTVVVFRSTDPAQWAPRGPLVHVAMTGASPEAVWGFAVNLMNARY